MITFTVPGLPQQQGSRRLLGVKNGRALSIDANPNLKPWRAEAIWYARQAYQGQPIDSPVVVAVTFTYPRPRNHYRTGKNAHLLKADAPAYKSTAPDTDKLCRATGDALEQAGLLSNDARIVRWGASKVWGDHASTQIMIHEVQ